jgi:hypothetical protein
MLVSGTQNRAKVSKQIWVGQEVAGARGAVSTMRTIDFILKFFVVILSGEVNPVLFLDYIAGSFSSL